jgi:hypothetical protein
MGKRETRAKLAADVARDAAENQLFAEVRAEHSVPDHLRQLAAAGEIELVTDPEHPAEVIAFTQLTELEDVRGANPLDPRPPIS